VNVVTSSRIYTRKDDLGPQTLRQGKGKDLSSFSGARVPYGPTSQHPRFLPNPPEPEFSSAACHLAESRLTSTALVGFTFFFKSPLGIPPTVITSWRRLGQAQCLISI
jgi:hypothetical protein